MALPTTDACLAAAEIALGRSLPPWWRARLLRDNGGEVEAHDDVWQVHPVLDTTDRKRAGRTASHLLRETAVAREWPRFPADAVAIAENGTGDRLVLRPDPASPNRFGDGVFHWDHETGTLTQVDLEDAG